MKKHIVWLNTKFALKNFNFVCNELILSLKVVIRSKHATQVMLIPLGENTLQEPENPSIIFSWGYCTQFVSVSPSKACFKPPFKDFPCIIYLEYVDYCDCLVFAY